jgi:N-acetylneuraminic acid mutarotase
LNDFAVLDLQSKLWLKPKNIQGSVEGRYRHSASATGKALYIFGGINQVQKRFNDVHEFVFEHQTWTRRIAINNFEPSTRTFHQSVIHDSWLYVFGGFDGNKTNDVYRA